MYIQEESSKSGEEKAGLSHWKNLASPFNGTLS